MRCLLFRLPWLPSCFHHHSKTSYFLGGKKQSFGVLGDNSGQIRRSGWLHSNVSSGRSSRCLNVWKGLVKTQHRFCSLSHGAKPETPSVCTVGEPLERAILDTISTVGKQLDAPVFETEYFIDLASHSATTEHAGHLRNRKYTGCIDTLEQLIKQRLEEKDPIKRAALSNRILHEGYLLPNRTHPLVAVGGEEANLVIETIGPSPDIDFVPSECVTIGRHMKCIKDQDNEETGYRSYFLLGDFARLEKALVRYTVDFLTKKGFQLVSVPDIVSSDIVRACGFQQSDPVYQLQSEGEGHHRATSPRSPSCPERESGQQLSLSGTAEISLSALLSGVDISRSCLPLKICAVSRAFRRESKEKNFYRVQEFTKVEMYSVCKPEDSDRIHEEFLEIQKDMFTSLGLRCRVLDMGTEELGAPAYRKFDIEAWMGGRKEWGEVSSTSNCTDYQSRRLNITMNSTEGGANSSFPHTVNATGCAIPRTMIAIVETHQNNRAFVEIPPVLMDYMEGASQLKGQRKFRRASIRTPPRWYKSY